MDESLTQDVGKVHDLQGEEDLNPTYSENFMSEDVPQNKNTIICLKFIDNV